LTVVSASNVRRSRGTDKLPKVSLLGQAGHGNFDPAAMTMFYGSLTERLVLKDKVQRPPTSTGRHACRHNARCKRMSEERRSSVKSRFANADKVDKAVAPCSRGDGAPRAIGHWMRLR
jgi:hypothetical protein